MNIPPPCAARYVPPNVPPRARSTVNLRTDSTLRGRLEQIAHDTTTWGYVAGQTVLSRYLGYKFRPWFEGAPTPTFDSFRSASATASTPKSIHRKSTLDVYPNPANDAVELTYTLPEGAAAGQVVLRDKFGKECARAELTAAGTTATLNVRGLLPGLYYYTYNVGAERLQAGTLMKW